MKTLIHWRAVAESSDVVWMTTDEYIKLQELLLDPFGNLLFGKRIVLSDQFDTRAYIRQLRRADRRMGFWRQGAFM